MACFAQGAFHITYEKRVDFDALRKKRIARATQESRPRCAIGLEGRELVAATGHN